MPWKECSVMDERLQFVARPLAGASDLAVAQKPVIQPSSAFASL